MMFGWVPDGTYDYVDYKTRYVMRNGNPVTVITKIWLEQGGPDDVTDELRQPWGAFPDFPPKPVKK